MRSNTRLISGEPCTCPYCTWARRERARRSAQRVAIATFLGSLAAFGVFWVAEGGIAVIAGTSAFALLVLAFLAGLES